MDQPNQRMVGLAVYTNPNAAAYARKKLHGFEYPPGQMRKQTVDIEMVNISLKFSGQRLIVKHDEGGGGVLVPSPGILNQLTQMLDVFS